MTVAQLVKTDATEDPRLLKKTLLGILRTSAAFLGNTLAVCRKYYVHAGLTACYLDGSLGRLATGFRARGGTGLSRDEQLLLHVLKQAE